VVFSFDGRTTFNPCFRWGGFLIWFTYYEFCGFPTINLEIEMLKIAIASLFAKNTKYASNTKIQGFTGGKSDGYMWYS